MFLSSPIKTLDVSFRVTCGESSYMVYASTDNLRCFECGDIGHKNCSCPHEQRAEDVAGTSGLSDKNSETNVVERPLCIE